MTERETKLMVVLQNLLSSLKPDETDQICLTNVEAAVYEANAVIEKLKEV